MGRVSPRHGHRGRPLNSVVRQHVSIVATIKQWWGWTGIEPIEVVAINAFGNVLVRDRASRTWRICPEDLYCRVVAEDAAQLGQLLKDAGFIEDWEMSALVHAAREKLGPLAEGRRYCLKVPGPIGGAYDAENIATAPIEDIISLSGDIANQIKDLPEGANITLKVVD